MLHKFLTDNHDELIARCRAKVAERPAREATGAELEHGITLFLDQLIKTLQVEQTAHPLQSHKLSGQAGNGPLAISNMDEGAGQHGRELLLHGFTIEQVVHDYGDLCQAITELALERRAPIDVAEYRTLNRCLDDAMANAVTQFNAQHNRAVADQQTRELNERLGFLAHELRNYLSAAMLALTINKGGSVGLSGSTGAVLDRSLIGLRNLIDRSLAEVRLTADMPAQQQLFSLADFIAEVKVSAVLEAQFRDCVFSVLVVDPCLAVKADRDLLFSALSNLLQNAFKFTRPGTLVTLSASSAAERILIEVEDHGEGLSPDFVEQMFLPFTQAGEDRSGLGLGLSIARRGTEASQGVLHARNKADGGAIFTIDLPRYALPELGSLELLSGNEDIR